LKNVAEAPISFTIFYFKSKVAAAHFIMLKTHSILRAYKYLFKQSVPIKGSFTQMEVKMLCFALNFDKEYSYSKLKTNA